MTCVGVPCQGTNITVIIWGCVPLDADSVGLGNVISKLYKFSSRFLDILQMWAGLLWIPHHGVNSQPYEYKMI